MNHKRFRRQPASVLQIREIAKCCVAALALVFAGIRFRRKMLWRLFAGLWPAK